MIKNMIRQVTQILHSMSELMFWIYYFCMVFLSFSIDKAIYLSFLFKFILFERSSNSLRGLGLPPYLEFINIISILFYNFIEFIILLHTLLVISFARYKEYIIFLISFSKFSDVLTTFTCASAIANI